MEVKITALVIMIIFHILFYFLCDVIIEMKREQQIEMSSKLLNNKYSSFIALLIYSFSWTFLITLPLRIHAWIIGGTWSVFLFIVIMLIHFIIGERVNLIENQSLNFIQIIITWVLWLCIL